MRTLRGRDLDRLLKIFREEGYTPVGPQVRDGAIVHDELASADDLPLGWSDAQGPGTYRLERRDGGARFGTGPGPQSWKRFLFPPRTHLFRCRRGAGGDFDVENEPLETPRYAFVGVRPCELQAIAVQDRVFLGSRHIDPTYRARREGLFTVGVQCGRSGATCFCASMGTGPGFGRDGGPVNEQDGTRGADLVLTELTDSGGSPCYVAVAGSPEGQEMLARLDGRATNDAERRSAETAVGRARDEQVRGIDPDGLPELLERSADSPHWDEVAERCLSCGNCTLVCPTCFCSTVEDTTHLDGATADRWRVWDVCFNVDFSYLHGGAVRTSVRARYRHWLTHKLGTWVEQFGTFGCVGCGRCITWCPVGIDLTEEVGALRALDDAPASSIGGVP